MDKREKRLGGQGKFLLFGIPFCEKIYKFQVVLQRKKIYH